jgi:hypothetical protein
MSSTDHSAWIARQYYAFAYQSSTHQYLDSHVAADFTDSEYHAHVRADGMRTGITAWKTHLRSKATDAQIRPALLSWHAFFCERPGTVLLLLLNKGGAEIREGTRKLHLVTIRQLMHIDRADRVAVSDKLAGATRSRCVRGRMFVSASGTSATCSSKTSNDDVVVSRTLVKDDRTKRRRPTANIAPSDEEKEACHSQATRPGG